MRVNERYLQSQLSLDLQHKMVFVAGPRQVGKTTLAKRQPGADIGYLNWDIADHRERILRQQLPISSLWVFDEVHKYRSWRNYLKGVYDGRPLNQQILVTGSAKLNLYSYGGESLQGRYHLLRLHPLSVAELQITDSDGWTQLLTLGGFPEPFYSGSDVEARRWSREYRNLLLNEEVRSLERVQDLGSLELLALRLPELVGSPLSVNALREDLHVSHRSVSSWLDILERLYAIFRLPPLGHTAIRAVKKEQKHYHLDWTLVPEAGPRFENLVAAHLHKWVHYQQDTQGRDLELRYFRDIEGREVDFVVTENRLPIFMVECKNSDREVDKNLRYLKHKFPQADAWQLSATGDLDYQSPEGIRVAPALAFLQQLV